MGSGPGGNCFECHGVTKGTSKTENAENKLKGRRGGEAGKEGAYTEPSMGGNQTTSQTIQPGVDAGVRVRHSYWKKQREEGSCS